MRYSYAYDAAGNITVKDTEHGAYAYGYDVLDRLTSEKGDATLCSEKGDATL